MPAAATALAKEAWQPPDYTGSLKPNLKPVPRLSRWRWLDWICEQAFRFGVLTRWLPPTDAWVVCKRRPLAELPAHKQQQIRQAYEDTDWSSDYSIEFVGIFIHEKEALEAASIPGGFFHHLPVGRPLPDEPVQWGAHSFPLSEATLMYEQHKCEIMAVRRCEVEAVARLATATKKAATAVATAQAHTSP